MVHMMQQPPRQEAELFQGMTPEQMTFLRRLLGGQQGDPTSPLSPGNAAGELFTGGPGHPTPELPDIPTPPITPPITPPTIPPITEPPPTTPPTIPPVIAPTPEIPWDEIDENNNGIPDAFEDIYHEQETPQELPPEPDQPIIYDPQPTHPNIPTTPPDHDHPHTGAQDHEHQYGQYDHQYPQYPYQTQSAIALAQGGAGGAGGQGGTISGFAPVFNINPAQRAVDVTMNAWDQYQQSLLDKYYADTLRDIAMAALGGGSGAGGDVVGPVGYSNLVTGALTRYQQPKPVVKKKRVPNPDWPPPPQNEWPEPRGAIMPTTMAGDPAAEGEPDGFDAGEFLSEVQADAAGGVPADVQADVARGIMPPIPPRPPQEDWSDRDTKKFLEKGNEPPGWGSGVMVDPGKQGIKLTLPNPMALASLQQRPPEVEEPGPIYDRHMGDRPPLPFPPQRPWPIGEPPKAADPLADKMAAIMSGAGVPLGGALANQINTQGQANELENLVTANRRGLDLARTAQGFKGEARRLQESQQAFRTQKAKDAMADLISKGPLSGPRLGPGTSMRVQA